MKQENARCQPGHHFHDLSPPPVVSVRRNLKRVTVIFFQLGNRYLASVTTQPSSTSKQNPPVRTPSNTLNTKMKAARGILETGGPREGTTGREIRAAAVAGAGVSMASEACVEEGIVLMEAEVCAGRGISQVAVCRFFHANVVACLATHVHS